MATSKHANHERVWDLIESIAMAMLVTRDGEKLRSRPMAAYIDRNAGMIYFLFDTHQHKEDEIRADPQVNLAFANADDQTYVSISGTAEVSNDRAKIKELFNTRAKAWWKDADDPNIRVLKVTPDDAQFWDSPGTAMSYVKMATAAMTGERPEMGDNAKVRM